MRTSRPIPHPVAFQLLACVLLVGISRAGRAQSPPPELLPPARCDDRACTVVAQARLAEARSFDQLGRREEVAGALYLIGGLGLSIGSGFLIDWAFRHPFDGSRDPLSTTQINLVRALGVSMAFSGAVNTVLGGVFLVRAQRHRAAARRIRELAVTGGPAGSVGAGLAFRY
jgi:hypothetical protein